MQILYYLIVFLVSFFFSAFCYKKVLSIAKEKNIVDNPDARKLQKEPIPVLGGITIYVGIIVGIFVALAINSTQVVMPIVCSMSLLLFIGMIDDIVSLSPNIRFFLEIVISIILILTTGCYIQSLTGIFGINMINPFIAYPLTVVTIVGVINAINLLDGVDGLSSGYSALVCLGYFLLFNILNQQEYSYLCLSAFASICPFYIHNVFGKKSKMFIGDGGTLMLGVIISAIVLKSFCVTAQDSLNYSMLTFSIATLSIPVFDTLRVMILRILDGKSPFYPDKKHLHHAFIRAGFSHFGTSIAEISLGGLAVLCWYILNYYNISITTQFVVLTMIGFIDTFVLYALLESGWLPTPLLTKHLLTRTKWYAKIREFVDR